MTEKLITIAQFLDINQASYVQAYLEANGIDAFLENDNITSMMPFLNVAVRLMVKEGEASKALEILSEKEHLPEEPTITLAPRYAGFWFRLFANMLDGTVFFPINFILSFISIIWLEMPKEVVFIKYTLFSILYWLYFSLMESSGYRATLGKRALGIVVTDYEGKKISFSKASARYWAKLLSIVTLGIGYIMAGFTRRKQALHDIVTGCILVRTYRINKDTVVSGRL
jgi:uncharacterized RDD family membrane protein YckC